MVVPIPTFDTNDDSYGMWKGSETMALRCTALKKIFEVLQHGGTCFSGFATVDKLLRCDARREKFERNIGAQCRCVLKY